MDLGIAGKKALVCAASKGLGRGCALALARNGVAVTITARTSEHARGRPPSRSRARPAPWSTPWPATSPRPRAAPPRSPPAPVPDILVNNAGGPPPGDFREWDENDWMQACNANMITAIMLIKAVVDGMRGARLRPDRQHHLELGQGADPAARPVERRALRPDRLRRRPRPPDRRRNVTINNILPGRFDTDRLRSGLAFAAQKIGSTEKPRSRPNSKDQVPARRFGHPDEFGALCAFICSAQASYITGQNFLIDGGAYPGTY